MVPMRGWLWYSHLDGRLVSNDLGGAHPLQPVCDAVLTALMVPHHRHAAQLQQPAELHQQLAHGGVCRI